MMLVMSTKFRSISAFFAKIRFDYGCTATGTRTMTGKTTIPRLRTPCMDCGMDYRQDDPGERRQHAVYHDETLFGSKARLDDGCHFVTHESPIARQRLAGKVAESARRETEFDFPLFGARKLKNDELKTIVVLYVENVRVVGLIVSRQKNSAYIADVRSFREDFGGYYRPTRTRKVNQQERRTVDLIWILERFRRRGLGSNLIQRLAEHCETTPQELAHSLPFRESAVRFWQASPERHIYVV
jgi:GNAT superfamily N-acetyltransferase